MAKIRRGGGIGLAVTADVTSLKSVQGLMQTATDGLGGIDILVINVGGNYGQGSVEESDPEAWLATLNVNLVGAYYCARTAIQHLKKRGGGKIITVGSGIGQRGRPGTSAYAIAKAGVWMLTRVLAQELWQDGISVNELVPGPVLTERVKETDAGREGSVFNIDSEWVKEPEDVVPLALFLATQPSTGPTAQNFNLMRRDT
ncbi:MAG: SDR family NAD(P)-dependent oxidoreductase [SAR202 cluster bacterium]|nr:SDR family NAD(P)-dependent oxidoreductase [SAR202 cluster bacterium]